MKCRAVVALFVSGCTGYVHIACKSTKLQKVKRGNRVYLDYIEHGTLRQTKRAAMRTHLERLNTCFLVQCRPTAEMNGILGVRYSLRDGKKRTALEQPTFYYAVQMDATAHNFIHYNTGYDALAFKSKWKTITKTKYLGTQNETLKIINR